MSDAVIIDAVRTPLGKGRSDAMIIERLPQVAS